MEIIIIVLTIIVSILIISIIHSHFTIDITKYIVKNDKIDKDIKLVFLSDLHNRKIYDKLSNIIHEEKPDIVLFGGDMINESINEIDNFFKLYELVKDYKVYYTFGNHEERMESCEELNYVDRVKKTNIVLLNNKCESLSKNMVIKGLANDVDTYLSFGKLGLSKDYIVSKVGENNPKKYNILVAHNPIEFDSYVDYGVDLVLGGHVHGGLVRTLLTKKGVLSPDVTFFPKYFEGLYEKDSTKMIVSRGIGYSKRISFRINNPAEVVIIELKP